MIPPEANDPAPPIVPIEELFFPDEGPHVIERAPHPPTTAGERLRADLAAHAIALRGLVERSRAPQGNDAGLVHEVAQALGAARSTLRSFGLHNGAAILGEYALAGSRIDLLQLAGLETAVSLMAEPGESGMYLERVAQDGLWRRGLYAAVARGFGRTAAMLSPAEPVAEPARAAPPQAHAAAPLQPHVGGRPSRGLAETLDAGITALDALVSRPLSAPVAIPEAAVVAIESLLYRGPRALQRAIEVRDEIRRAKEAGASPQDDALDELFDLLDLAARG